MKDRPRPLLAILVGGLGSGVLDILYAFVLGTVRDASPLRVLQSVASGVYGRMAFEGGYGTALLGLQFHVCITIVAAALYVFAAKRMPWLVRHFVLAGSFYGIVVYLVMNLIVVPMSAAPFTLAQTPAALAQGFVSHAVLVGIPIAWAARRFGHRDARH